MQRGLMHACWLGGLTMCLGMKAAHSVTYLEQIDRLGAINAALLDFHPAALPGPRRKGLVEVAVELEPVPKIDNRIGAKTEPVHTFPIIGRARMNWSPISGVRLGGFLIPPLKVQGTTAHLMGLEAEYGWVQGKYRSSVRLFTTQGNVTGAFSEPNVTDKFNLNSTGMDIRTGWFPGDIHLYGGELAVYGGLGAGHNKTGFVMGADGAVIDGQRGFKYILAGMGWISGHWTLVAEQQRTFSYYNNITLTAIYGL